MPICSVPTCTSTHRSADKNINLYRFPKNDNYARIWGRSCMKRDSFNTKTAFICSLHFSSEAYQRDINYDFLGFTKQSLRKDAVPTLQLPSLGMLKKNNIETLKNEHFASYYKAEKGYHPEESIPLLVDLLPSLSPKSLLSPLVFADIFSSPRKNKFRSKLHALNVKYPTETTPVLQPSEYIKNQDEKTEYNSERNDPSVILSVVNIDEHKTAK